MVLARIKSFDELNDLSKEGIVCFGAGRALRKLFLLCKKDPYIDSIRYVIDNDPEKWGKKIELSGNRTLLVRPPDILSKKTQYAKTIIISNTNPEPITEQIQSIPGTENSRILFYSDIVNLAFTRNISSANIPGIIGDTMDQLIPKVIHYCWFGGNPIPEEYREWMKSWKKHCPDYEIVEWNESNYDFKKHAYMQAAYEAGRYAFVSDYARLDIVYHYGGVYLDLDVEILKNIDSFLCHKGFGGYQTDGRFATGLGFGAIPHLPLIFEFMKEYDGIEFVDFSSKEERRTKKIKTCPDIQTEFINRMGYFWDNSVTDIDGFRIYPAPVFDGMISLDHMLTVTEDSYMLHHYAGSWMP